MIAFFNVQPRKKPQQPQCEVTCPGGPPGTAGLPVGHPAIYSEPKSMDQISRKTPNPKCRLIFKIYQ
jgi:hypothetical protein